MNNTDMNAAFEALRRNAAPGPYVCYAHPSNIPWIVLWVHGLAGFKYRRKSARAAKLLSLGLSQYIVATEPIRSSGALPESSGR